ncbi:hypothetical protein DEH81_21110 [Pectobacterium zantedeschiae]|nr:hypothetical protein DEH81_21110 [Pectobacterium zantedeschiae]
MIMACMVRITAANARLFYSGNRKRERLFCFASSEIQPFLAKISLMTILKDECSTKKRNMS